jgi:hypothetical protein
MQRLERQYPTKAKRLQREGLEELALKVRNRGYFDDACELAKLLGYTVHEHSSGFLGSSLEITVKPPQGAVIQFNSKRGFNEWVLKCLC